MDGVERPAKDTDPSHRLDLLIIVQMDAVESSFYRTLFKAQHYTQYTSATVTWLRSIVGKLRLGSDRGWLDRNPIDNRR